MKKLLSCSLILLSVLLTSCNLFGGLSSPSDDNQYLVAARACLDQGDYDCAIKNYNALSSVYNDEKVSEESLTLLAQKNIFSISDLVASLGTNLGSASSFSFLAVAMEERGIVGVAGSAARTTIKTVYDDDLSITDVKLRAFSKFIAALAMFNEVLANAVGTDGQLTASDIVASPSTCTTALSPGCAAPAGTALTYDVLDTSSFAISGNTGNGDWSGHATIQKLITAASEAGNEFALFGKGSTSTGILATINTLSHVSGADTACRFGIIQALGLQ